MWVVLYVDDWWLQVENKGVSQDYPTHAKHSHSVKHPDVLFSFCWRAQFFHVVEKRERKEEKSPFLLFLVNRYRSP